MPASDAARGRCGRHRARHEQVRLAAVVVADLDVVPFETTRSAKRLGDGLLRRKGRGQRLRLRGALEAGKQPVAEMRRPLETRGEPFEVDNVDADPDYLLFSSPV